MSLRLTRVETPLWEGEASKADEPVAAKEEVLENKPKPKARPIQKSKENPGVPEPPLPAGTSVQAMRSGPVLAQSSVAKASRADSQRNGTNVGSRVV